MHKGKINNAVLFFCRPDDVCDENNVPGYGRVTELARALIHLSDQLYTRSLGNDEFNAIGHLWHQLDRFDKYVTHIN